MRVGTYPPHKHTHTHTHTRAPVYAALDEGWNFGSGIKRPAYFDNVDDTATPAAGWNICSRSHREYGYFDTVRALGLGLGLGLGSMAILTPYVPRTQNTKHKTQNTKHKTLSRSLSLIARYHNPDPDSYPIYNPIYLYFHV